MAEPLAYFITFTCYGTWLHGRAPGSVDREHNMPGTPYMAPDPYLERNRVNTLRQEPYILDAPRRAAVLRTIREVVAHRRWKLWAAHIRTNHGHVVVTAFVKPEKVMIDLKAWASRRLRESFGESADRDRWTQHGSTRYLNTEAALTAAVAYVVDEQGEKMECFDYRNEPDASATELRRNEPDASATEFTSQ